MKPKDRDLYYNSPTSSTIPSADRTREIPDALSSLRHSLDTQQKSLEALRTRLTSVLRNENDAPEIARAAKALPGYTSDLANNIQNCEMSILSNNNVIDELHRLLEL